MGWSIGYDRNWQRDIGYGVPAQCDHPGCTEEIHRGLRYVCGSEPFGGEKGCGLYFCEAHLLYTLPEEFEADMLQRCARCMDGGEPFIPSPDVAEWLRWKLADKSWAEWRGENPGQVAAMKAQLGADAA